MSEQTWAYSYPVGEWIFPVSIPLEEQRDAMVAFQSLLHRSVSMVRDGHRLRGATLSWGEYDAEGRELHFHELEELSELSWENLQARLSEVMASSHRVAVSALFLSLDTRIITSLDGQEDWSPESAELQLSFVQPELHPTELGVMYSTMIDVWLPSTVGPGGARRSNPLAEQNEPRLEQLLRALASIASGEPSLGQSKLYADALTAHGFSR